MRVARLHAAGDIRLHDEPTPTPNADESLIRVTAVGICGSDVRWYSEAGLGDARLDQPLVVGHDFAGMIESTGQRVAVDPQIPCNQCEPCREGNPNLCLAQRFAGHGAQDGAMCEYIGLQPRCLHPLSDTLTGEVGAMLEPLGIAIHAVDLAHVKAGTTVGKFGCGPIGLLTIQVVRMAGSTCLIATDELVHRIQSAESFGAQVFDASGDESRQILSATVQVETDVPA
jgi:L-iditol 2-dehydrogenase